MIISENINDPRPKADIVTPLIIPFHVGKYCHPAVTGTRNEIPLPTPCPTPNSKIKAVADVTRLEEKKQMRVIKVPVAAVLK